MNNLSLAVDRVAFHLFGWPVTWYGLIIVVGIFIAYEMIRREGIRQDLSEEVLLDDVFWCVISGIIGARLYYVCFQWDYFRHHPGEIIQIWHGGLAIYGGILAGGACLIYRAWRTQRSMRQLLDVAVPGLLVAQAIGRWGNFVNQEAYGNIVDPTLIRSWPLPDWLIEQMYIEGAYRQPTFLYESFWSALGVVFLLVIRRVPQGVKLGELTALYLIWYGVGRFFIEGLRSDSLYWGPVRVSQLVSLILVILGLGYLVWSRRQGATQPYYEDVSILLESE